LRATYGAILVKRRGPHLILGLGIWGYAGLLATRWLRRRGVRVTFIVNSYTTMEYETRMKLRGISAHHGRVKRARAWIEHAWSRDLVSRYERQTCLGAHRVLVNCESVRRLLVGAYGRFGLGDTIHVIPYTSEAAFVRARPEAPVPMPRSIAALAKPDAPLIVTVSRHDSRKGLDVLLHALAELRSTGATFRACMVGGGTMLEAHRRLARRLGLADVLSIEGRVAECYDYLHHADVFVLPSIQEGSGSLSLIEALQAGVAVVASNVDGIPEDISDGDGALLVPPGDARALSRAIGRLIADAELRECQGRHSRAAFERRFSPEEFTRALPRELRRAGLRGRAGIARPAAAPPGPSPRRGLRDGAGGPRVPRPAAVWSPSGDQAEQARQEDRHLGARHELQGAVEVHGAPRRDVQGDQLRDPGREAARAGSRGRIPGPWCERAGPPSAPA
jgi:glycosyltransferase involved in cell wall biosynthesis